MSDENLFYTDNRWNNLYAYADALGDMVRAGADPVENVLVTLSLVLEQFPESPPLDPESHHVNCVHHLVKTVLGALRKDKIARIERGEDMDGPAPAGPSRPRS